MELKVKGMHCKSCELLITDALADIGVQATADHKTGTVQINGKADLNKVKDAIKKEGYTL